MSDSSIPKWLIPTSAISGLLLIILFALGLLGGGEKIPAGKAENNAPALPKNAQTLTLHSQTAANNLAWQGVIRSRELVKIAPKLNARIIELAVHASERVAKGAVIARLDDRDLRAAVSAAQAAQAAVQAQANQADIEARRTSELYQKQAATKQNYDAVLAQAKTAHAQLNQAASAVQQAQVMLGENVLVAPFDGIVGERLQEVGDMALPNQAIITFYKPNDLRLEAPIASACANQVKLGMSVNVKIDALKQSVSGKVDEISPEVDPQTRSQTIKVSLPNTKGLQHGQFAWLELACQAGQSALLIPNAAIIHYGQLQAVQVVDKGTVSYRHIRTGKAYGEQVEVLSGLHEGDNIIINSGLQP
ncbi:MAG: efflux RND transporter periplasmic adaptor subunit [Methylococcaceae bacterium]